MSTTKINAATAAANNSDNDAAKVAKISPTLIDSLAAGQNKVTSFSHDDKGNLTVSFESPVKFSGQGVNKPLIKSITDELASNHLTIDKTRSSQVSWYLRHDATIKVGRSRESSSAELDSRVAFMLAGCASYLIGVGLTSPVSGECRKNGSDWEPIEANEPLAWTAFRFGLADGIRETDHTTKVKIDLDATKVAIQDALIITMNDEEVQNMIDSLVSELDAREETRKLEAEAANQTA